MQEVYYQSLRIFISSPGDVNAERQIAEEVISKVDIRIRDVLGLHADCIRWEHQPPSTPSPGDGKIQDAINEIIKSCHVFVLILHRRYGSIEPDQKKSNTEREVDLALEMLRDKKKLMFLSYFRELPSNVDVGAQEQKVIELRQRLERDGVLYKLDFCTVTVFAQNYMQ